MKKSSTSLILPRKSPLLWGLIFKKKTGAYRYFYAYENITLFENPKDSVLMQTLLPFKGKKKNSISWCNVTETIKPKSGDSS